MVGSIFIIKNRKITLLPEAIALTEHLKEVEDDQLKWLILVNDTVFSPYKMKPREERKLIATRMVWPEYKDFDPEKVVGEIGDKFRSAQEEYISLIYHSNLYRLDEINSKLNILNQKLFLEETTTGLKTIGDAIKFFEDMRERILGEMEKDEDEFAGLTLKGDIRLSLIEKMKKRREDSKIRRTDEVNFSD